jgi:hypothetical protein
MELIGRASAYTVCKVEKPLGSLSFVGVQSRVIISYVMRRFARFTSPSPFVDVRKSLRRKAVER